MDKDGAEAAFYQTLKDLLHSYEDFKNKVCA
jgi:hypothetical protein